VWRFFTIWGFGEMLTQNDVLELLHMWENGTPKEKAWAKKQLREWLEETRAAKQKKINAQPLAN